MNFQNKFRNLRLKNGLSQYEIAQKLGTTQSSITAWEHGVRTPGRTMMLNIAKVFNVPVSYLMSDTESDTDVAQSVVYAFESKPQLRILFDRARRMSDADLDAMNSIASAIIKENYGDVE